MLSPVSNDLTFLQEENFRLRTEIMNLRRELRGWKSQLNHNSNTSTPTRSSRSYSDLRVHTTIKKMNTVQLQSAIINSPRNKTLTPTSKIRPQIRGTFSVSAKPKQAVPKAKRSLSFSPAVTNYNSNSPSMTLSLSFIENEEQDEVKTTPVRSTPLNKILLSTPHKSNSSELSNPTPEPTDILPIGDLKPIIKPYIIPQTRSRAQSDFGRHPKSNRVQNRGAGLEGLLRKKLGKNTTGIAKSLTPKALTTDNLSSTGQVNLAKYKMMLRIGVDVAGACTQMLKDGVSAAAITKFRADNGGGDDSKQDEDMDPVLLAKNLGLKERRVIKKPSVSMKKIHWHKVNMNSIDKSIWKGVDDAWFKYNEKEFELKFQSRISKPKKYNRKLKGHPSSQPGQNMRKEHIRFIEAKRSQQVQIGMKGLNIGFTELRRCILALDDDKLKMDEDRVKTLLAIVPTPAEQLQAEKAAMEDGNDAKDRVQYFGVPEKFFYHLYDIVELGPRIEMWKFKIEFEHEVASLQAKITDVTQMKTKIVRSNNLRHMFGIILAFGNHMNFGNKLGNTFGFHLSDLSLLPQIKTFDNSMTLPMFLYSFCEKHYPEVLNIVDEFGRLESLSTMSSDIVILKKYEYLKANCTKLSNMIDRFRDEYQEISLPDDFFLARMQTFHKKAAKTLWKLKFKMDSFHRTHKKLLEFFSCEESIAVEVVFTNLYLLITMLKNAKKKLIELDRDRRRRMIKRRRRRRSIDLTQRKMKELRTPVSTKRYAMGVDDIGTPVQKQQLLHVKNQRGVSFGSVSSAVLTSANMKSLLDQNAYFNEDEENEYSVPRLAHRSSDRARPNRARNKRPKRKEKTHLFNIYKKQKLKKEQQTKPKLNILSVSSGFESETESEENDEDDDFPAMIRGQSVGTLLRRRKDKKSLSDNEFNIENRVRHTDSPSKPTAITIDFRVDHEFSLEENKDDGVFPKAFQFHKRTSRKSKHKSSASGVLRIRTNVRNKKSKSPSKTKPLTKTKSPSKSKIKSSLKPKRNHSFKSKTSIVSLKSNKLTQLTTPKNLLAQTDSSLTPSEAANAKVQHSAKKKTSYQKTAAFRRKSPKRAIPTKPQNNKKKRSKSSQSLRKNDKQLKKAPRRRLPPTPN